MDRLYVEMLPGCFLSIDLAYTSFGREVTEAVAGEYRTGSSVCIMIKTRLDRHRNIFPFFCKTKTYESVDVLGNVVIWHIGLGVRALTKGIIELKKQGSSRRR